MLFAIACAVSLGLTLADAAYAAVLRGAMEAARVAAALASVADLLLLALAANLILGVAAVGAAWHWSLPRWLLILALVLTCGEIFAPWLAPEGLPFPGAVLRSALHGGATALALLAWQRVPRPQCVIA